MRTLEVTTPLNAEVHLETDPHHGTEYIEAIKKNGKIIKLQGSTFLRSWANGNITPTLMSYIIRAWSNKLAPVDAYTAFTELDYDISALDTYAVSGVLGKTRIGNTPVRPRGIIARCNGYFRLMCYELGIDQTYVRHASEMLSLFNETTGVRYDLKEAGLFLEYDNMDRLQPQAIKDFRQNRAYMGGSANDGRQSYKVAYARMQAEYSKKDLSYYSLDYLQKWVFPDTRDWLVDRLPQNVHHITMPVVANILKKSKPWGITPDIEERAVVLNKRFKQNPSKRYLEILSNYAIYTQEISEYNDQFFKGLFDSPISTKQLSRHYYQPLDTLHQFLDSTNPYKLGLFYGMYISLYPPGTRNPFTLTNLRDYSESYCLIMKTEVAPIPEDFQKEHDVWTLRASVLKQPEMFKGVEERDKHYEDTLTLRGIEWKFQPIYTPEALVAEGRRMDHCVGGYAKRVADGSTIVHVEDDKGLYQSTIEIRANRIIQWAGYSNSRVQHRAHMQAVESWAIKHNVSGGY